MTNLSLALTLCQVWQGARKNKMMEEGDKKSKAKK
jgi:hypothetical protein